MEHIDRIYCLVHPFYERARLQRLHTQMEKANIPSEKVTYGAATWGSELNSSTIFTVYDPFLRPGLPNFSWKSRCLSKGEISLVLNFYAAAKHAVDNNYKYIIIFESDVFLRSDFCKGLQELWTDLSGNWDYVSLGEGIGTRPPNVPNSYWSPVKAYTPPHQCVFRCTDSMLLNVEFLRKVVETILPFRECLDWELNYQLAIHQGVSYWADPPLAEQGSSRMRDASLLPA